ncbi:3 5 -cyclic nucleotide phosphodiesterase domain-containing protein, partial [Cystoisospora suis]
MTKNGENYGVKDQIETNRRKEKKENIEKLKHTMSSADMDKYIEGNKRSEGKRMSHTGDDLKVNSLQRREITNERPDHLPSSSSSRSASPFSSLPSFSSSSSSSSFLRSLIHPRSERNASDLATSRVKFSLPRRRRTERDETVMEREEAPSPRTLLQTRDKTNADEEEEEEILIEQSSRIMEKIEEEEEVKIKKNKKSEETCENREGVIYYYIGDEDDRISLSTTPDRYETLREGPPSSSHTPKSRDEGYPHTPWSVCTPQHVEKLTRKTSLSKHPVSPFSPLPHTITSLSMKTTSSPSAAVPFSRGPTSSFSSFESRASVNCPRLDRRDRREEREGDEEKEEDKKGTDQVRDREESLKERTRETRSSYRMEREDERRRDRLLFETREEQGHREEEGQDDRRRERRRQTKEEEDEDEDYFMWRRTKSDRRRKRKTTARRGLSSSSSPTFSPSSSFSPSSTSSSAVTPVLASSSSSLMLLGRPRRSAGDTHNVQEMKDERRRRRDSPIFFLHSTCQFYLPLQQLVGLCRLDGLEAHRRREEERKREEEPLIDRERTTFRKRKNDLRPSLTCFSRSSSLEMEKKREKKKEEREEERNGKKPPPFPKKSQDVSRHSIATEIEEAQCEGEKKISEKEENKIPLRRSLIAETPLLLRDGESGDGIPLSRLDTSCSLQELRQENEEHADQRKRRRNAEEERALLPPTQEEKESEERDKREAQPWKSDRKAFSSFSSSCFPLYSYFEDGEEGEETCREMRVFRQIRRRIGVCWGIDPFQLQSCTKGKALQAVGLELFAYSPSSSSSLSTFFQVDKASLKTRPSGSSLYSFLEALSLCYSSSIPYHNAVHAADVTHMLRCLLTIPAPFPSSSSSAMTREKRRRGRRRRDLEKEGREISQREQDDEEEQEEEEEREGEGTLWGLLGKTQRAASIISAMAHDVGHPGTTNSF